MKVEKNAVIKDPRILGVFLLVVLGLLIYFVFTQKAKATFTPNWSPWSSCQHLDGKKGLWKYRRCLVGNNGPACSWGQLGSYQYEECPKPTNTPTPTLVPTATPSATPTPTEQPKQGCEEGYVEVEEECVPVPTPTREPEPTPWPGFSDPGPGSAPVCTDGSVVLLPLNLHVLREPTKATVKYQPTGGNQLDVYFKELGQPGWTHALGNEPNDGFVVVDHLNPNLGYVFGVRQHNGCGSGETVTAVVIDGPQSRLFPFSYWEWTK